MKKETEKKLLNLITKLSGNESMKYIVSELQSILVCEENDVKFGKVDIYKFAGHEKYRPVLNGVYHDQGWRVASDGHIMIAVKQDYSEDLEGKVIAKDGSVIEGNYPKWQKIMPTVFEGWKTFKVDMEEVAGAMKEVKAHTKIHGKGQCQFSLNGDVWLRAELFMLYASVLKEAGINEIKYIESTRCVVSKTDTLQLLLMPCWPPTEEELADETKLYKTLHGINK